MRWNYRPLITSYTHVDRRTPVCLVRIVCSNTAMHVNRVGGVLTIKTDGDGVLGDANIVKLFKTASRALAAAFGVNIDSARSTFEPQNNR